MKTEHTKIWVIQLNVLKEAHSIKCLHYQVRMVNKKKISVLNFHLKYLKKNKIFKTRASRRK